MKYGTIAERFRQTAQFHPDNIFLQMKDHTEYRRYTFRQTLDSVQSIQYFFDTIRFDHNDRAAILSENRPEWAIAYLGIVWRGNTAVPLDTHNDQTALVNLLNDSKSNVVFCSEQYLDTVLDAIPKLKQSLLVVCFDRVANPGKRLTSRHLPRNTLCFFDDLVTRDPAYCVVPTHDENHLASIIYTSGTTGTPKGVMLTHKNFLACGKANITRAHITPRTRCLSVLPLYHTFEFSGSLISSILAGSSITFTRSLKGNEIVAIMRENKATLMCGVPLLWEQFDKTLRDTVAKKGPIATKLFNGMIAAASLFPLSLRRFLFRKIHKQFGGHLSYCISGGAAIRPEVAIRFRRMGFHFLEGYGLTETAPVISYNSNVERKPGSVGICFPGTELRIVNPDNNGIGEVCYRGPNVMHGYYNNERATRETIDQDGFLHTGDLGYVDEDGYLTICGRLKNLIVLPGGKNVYPDELEEHYGSSPHIEEIGVMGIDRGRGEEIIAVAVPTHECLRGKSFAETEHAILNEIKRLSRALPRFKRIATTFISLDPLPKTAIGKIKKAELKQYVWEKISSQHNPIHITPTISAADEHLIESSEGKIIMRLLESMVRDAGVMKKATLDSRIEGDLGLDSLSRVELGIALQDEFHVLIGDSELFELDTVRDLITKIHEEIARGNTVESNNLDRNWSDALFHHDETISEAIDRPQPLWRHVLLRGFCALSRLLWRLEVEGVENIPESACIFAPNHASHTDVFWVTCSLPRGIGSVVYALGKKEHFERSVTRVFATAANVIPVDRSGNFLPALRAGAHILSQGRKLFLHPEGTRTSDGSLLRFKPGVGILAQELKVPVIPIAIIGNYEIYPNNHLLPRLFNWRKLRRYRLKVVFGKPITVEGELSAGVLKAAEHEIADRFSDHLRTRVADLLGRT